MAQRRLILNRKKAAQKIRKITRAMAVIASMKLQKLRNRMLAAESYAEKLRDMVAVLAANVGDSEHPLLRQPSVENLAKRIALLLITSNRGLAGAYNSNVLRMASDFIREQEAEGTAVELYVTGKKGVSYYTFHNRPIAQRYEQPGDRPTFADVEKAAAFLVDRFTSGQIESAHVAYTKFVSAGVQQPELLTLLPIAAATDAAAENGGQSSMFPGETGGPVMYEFSPDPDVLLAELLPRVLEAGLFECFLNAATSENAARRIAMMRATANADQMSKALTLRYNRARQEHITSELLDIIGATEATRNR